MKKLALALVCLVSVAFFASCEKTIENPEPSISVITEEGYVQNGDVVDLNQVFVYGFQMASNTETNKELKQLSVATTLIDLEGNEQTSEEIVALTGLTEYRFIDSIFFEMERDVIGSVKFTATVTDVDDKTNTATMTLSINQPAQPLIGTTFTWYRLGNTITGLDEYGLAWKGNYPKDTYAKLVPQDGVKLFIFKAEDWENVKTDIDKAAFFLTAIETQETAEEYFEVNVTQANMTYDDVIGTVMADGTCHLIHVTKSHAETVTGQGTAVTITGEAK